MQLLTSGKCTLRDTSFKQFAKIKTQLYTRSTVSQLLSWDLHLKVPKCEIFDPFFLTPINPIWVGDLRTGEKKKNFEDNGRYSPFFFFYAG
jgi:hypothetical protein